MTKAKFEIGQFVKPHQDWDTNEQCFVCGKELKDVEVETRVALTENHTLLTLDEINAQWFGTDWSPRVGNECVKRFPAEAVFTTQNN
jgi:hypothetical protein